MSQTLRLSKKPFVLLEILIGLSLMSMLLVFLFSFLAQNMRMEQKMEQARSALLERQNVQLRLQDLFTSLTRAQLQSPLYTQPLSDDDTPSLILHFDNGIDPDPAFSGPLLARLYLENQNLCLVFWPLEEKNKWRKEILLTHVTHLSYQFLHEKNWLISWPKERTDVPPLIRLQLQQEGRPLQFAFRLPLAEPFITYRRLPS